MFRIWDWVLDPVDGAWAILTSLVVNMGLGFFWISFSLTVFYWQPFESSPRKRAVAVHNRYIMKKKWLFFAYKQFDTRNSLLPITKAPKSYTAAVTLLQYSGIAIPTLGFDLKLFISHCLLCFLYKLTGRLHGCSFWLSHCCGL